MAAKKNIKGNSLWDNLIGELMSAKKSESPLSICLSGDRKKIAAVPLRYRLIALGFVQGLQLEDVNKKLLENGCEKLYARSLWEATLIYAFKNMLSYTSWKYLLEECSSVKADISSENQVLSSSTLSMREIRAYIDDNSVQKDKIAKTQHRTQILAQQLSEIGADRQAFRLFVLSNVSSFSTVREKTRYYFCKYLLYYLNSRMEPYITALERNVNIKNAWEKLSVFRVRTALDRKKHSPEDAREKIMDSALSYGAIYDAFENFFFGYITQDWLQILLDYYGKLSGLTKAQKNQLASEVRRRNKTLAGKSDDEAITWLEEEMERKEKEADALYALDNKKAVYQRGRAGENFLRKILHGDLDPDRVTFLSFLLFFGKEAEKQIPPEHCITEERLNEILSKCGFPTLDPDRSSDLFFIDFLKADDPMLFLMEEAETMAFSEENFHLYKTYLSSDSNEKNWKEIME
ncbi:MAG: hypothetical protein II969_18095 [Anaerolineaceae bacterium]|nr:hypothetical protein [Anaerolineaceae bacterium]